MDVGLEAPWALLRVDDLPGLAGGRAAGEIWWRFERPAAVLSAERPGEVPTLLHEVEASGRWAVGFVAYEAASGFDSALCTHPLPPGVPAAWFALFDRPEPAAELPGAAASTLGLAPRLAPSISETAYLDRLAAVRRAIARGDTYQVNFTYRLRGALEACGGPEWEGRVLDLFTRLYRAQTSPFAACLHLGDAALCSVSPELFFRRTGERIECRPMKGTAARGRTGDEDRHLAARLQGSVKERAENLMIVDMVRNDLGRVARTGTVRVPSLFEVERYETVLQMTTRVEARSEAPLAELFCALFPCASVTGAPKVSTMGLVATLEDAPRGVYTGAVGVVAPGGDARFSVAIRTAWLDRRADGEGDGRARIEYGTGGGIVWDSDPGRELAETHLKAEALRRALKRQAPDFELLETLLWRAPEGYRLLDRHLDRLAASADYFAFPVDLGQARRRLEEAARGLPPRRHRVRLLCDRRGGVRVEVGRAEAAPRPLRVAPAVRPVDSRDPFLWHKTTRREVYESALAAARERAAAAGVEVDDVVLWNERGELTETTLANLVLELDGRRLTPPVECGLLAGTFRAELLDTRRVRERTLTLSDLERAEAVHLVNSVRGWIPARLVHLEPGGRSARPCRLGHQEPAEPMSPSRRSRFSSYAWGVLAYTVLVAVWGAFVRATGSGAGCGNHWPLCNGEVLPRAESVETLIELSHRATSGVLGPLVLVLMIWAGRRFGWRHRVALAAVAGFVLTAVEGLLGAGLVRFELVADDASITRGFVIAAHLVNTFLLLAALALTAAWGSATGKLRLRGQGAAGWLVAGGLAALCVLGASGAVTALGDTLFPVARMTEQAIQELPPSARVLVRLRVLHPFLAVAVAAYLLVMAAAVRTLRPGRRIDRLTWGLGALFAVELAAGLLNVALAAPVWLQLVHLGLAYLVWLTLVLLAAEALSEGQPEAQPGQLEIGSVERTTCIPASAKRAKARSASSVKSTASGITTGDVQSSSR